MDLLERLDNLQVDVGEWAMANFGEQESKTATSTYYPAHKDYDAALAESSYEPGTREARLYLYYYAGIPEYTVGSPDSQEPEAIDARIRGALKRKAEPITAPLILGSLAPLLGVGEEIGEYAEADTPEDEDDALADCLIYLCDYAEREKTRLRDNAGLECGCHDLSIAYGRLVHVVLKRHQGIRGFQDDAKYASERDAAIADLITTLASKAGSFGGDVREGFARLVELGEKTYANVVSKRDWTEERNGS